VIALPLALDAQGIERGSRGKEQRQGNTQENACKQNRRFSAKEPVELTP
jgi:hypothetical protein